MHKLLNETIEGSLIEFGGSQSIKLYYDPTRKIGLAESVMPYMPMDEFMDTFRQVTEMVEEFKLTTLIFDKRILRAFHQPSMEWYYVQWKPKVAKLGLKTHYKILPREDWFRKCVEAGKEDIQKSYGDEFLGDVTITYVESIQEAFADIAHAGSTASEIS